MKILALEFSSPVRAVAVSDGGDHRGHAEEQGGRETHPFALIEAALKQAGLARGDIECIAVGLGPGSYAGVRTAIAIAQGWQLARGAKLLGISSAEVVASRAGHLGNADVWVGLEVQRGEIHAAHYDASSFAHPRLIEGFRRISPADAAGRRLKRMDQASGPDSGHGEAFPPSAEFLALLAAHRTGYVSGSALEPVYSRPAEFVKAPPPKFAAE